MLVRTCILQIGTRSDELRSFESMGIWEPINPTNIKLVEQTKTQKEFYSRWFTQHLLITTYISFCISPQLRHAFCRSNLLTVASRQQGHSHCLNILKCKIKNRKPRRFALKHPNDMVLMDMLRP